MNEPSENSLEQAQELTTLHWYRLKERFCDILRMDQLYDLGHLGRGFTDFKTIKVNAEVEGDGRNLIITFDQFALIEAIINALNELPDISSDKFDLNNWPRRDYINRFIKLLEERRDFISTYKFHNSNIIIDTDVKHFDYQVKQSYIEEL